MSKHHLPNKFIKYTLRTLIRLQYMSLLNFKIEPIYVNWDNIWCFVFCQEINRQKSSKSISIGQVLGKTPVYNDWSVFQSSNYTMGKYKWSSFVWSYRSRVGLKNWDKINSGLRSVAELKHKVQGEGIFESVLIYVAVLIKYINVYQYF